MLNEKLAESNSNNNNNILLQKKRELKNEINHKSSNPHKSSNLSYVLPLSKYNFKTLKREYINKKIIRLFKKFLKNNNLIKKEYIQKQTFWHDFIYINLLPPMNYTEKNHVNIEFKSFSKDFMIWLFSQTNADLLYDKFYESEGENIFSSKEIENVSITEKKMLREYIENLVVIYSNCQNSEKIKLEEIKERSFKKESKKSGFTKSSMNNSNCDSFDVEPNLIINKATDKELTEDSIILKSKEVVELKRTVPLSNIIDKQGLYLDYDEEKLKYIYEFGFESQHDIM